MKNIQDEIEDEKKSASALAMLLAVKSGVTQKEFVSFPFFEHEVGPFPDNIEEFTEHLLRLQGHDLEYLRGREGEVFIEVFPGKNLRILIVVITV